MDLLFKKDTSDYIKVLREPARAFSLSTDYFVSEFNRTMASFIINSGKAEALFFICIMVFVLVLFKNLFRYLAMYFVAPIRNGVVRDLRNKLLSKTLNLPLSYYSDERKGDIMSRMTSDVQEIEWSVVNLRINFQRTLNHYYFFVDADFH